MPKALSRAADLDRFLTGKRDGDDSDPLGGVHGSVDRHAIDLLQFMQEALGQGRLALETDVLAGFVLARAAAGLADGTIASDVGQVRAWFGRPLWEMEPPDADGYFAVVLRDAAKGTRLSRAQALKTYFLFLELRHKVEIHQMTGRVVECPIDEMNRPRGRHQAKLRIPPAAGQVDRLFAGWREDLSTCRKFAPNARNYTACKLMADVGQRVNEVCKLEPHPPSEPPATRP